MKNILKSAGLALFALSFLFLSCSTLHKDWKKTGEFATKTVSYKFSEPVKLQLAEPVEDQGLTDIIVNLTIDYPLNNGNNVVAVSTIRDYINNYLSFYNGFKKVYAGEMDKAQEVADFYGESFKDHFISQNEFPAPELSYNIEIKKAFENDKCVTYTFMIDMYLGGAHGGRTFYGKTIKKTDGSVLDNFIHVKDVEDDGLTAIIKKGLMSYWDITDMQELYNFVWEEKVSEYFAALPQYSPCFTDEGVLFCYQEYEIAPYAAGAPEFIVPYNEIEKYLTPSAAELLK